MSYLDHLDFGIIADRDQVDDVWALLDRARRSLDELAAACNVAEGAEPAERLAGETGIPVRRSGRAGSPV